MQHFNSDEENGTKITTLPTCVSGRDHTLPGFAPNCLWLGYDGWNQGRRHLGVSKHELRKLRLSQDPPQTIPSVSWQGDEEGDLGCSEFLTSGFELIMAKVLAGVGWGEVSPHFKP